MFSDNLGDLGKFLPFSRLHEQSMCVSNILMCECVCVCAEDYLYALPF